jgi:hypothetical protein
VRLSRVVALVVGAVVLFALGVAVGQALHDSTPPEGRQTQIRTLHPVQLPPARVTVTVTTSGP